MAEDNRSLIRSLIEKVTAMQIAVIVIGLSLIVGLAWFIVDRGKVLSDNKDFLPNFITFLAAIGILAIVLLAVLYVIFGRTNGEGSSGPLVSQISKMIGDITPMEVASTLIGLTVIVAIAWFMHNAFSVQQANQATSGNVLLSSDAARGIITFSVAIVTVALAMMLMFFLIFSVPTQDIKDRFTFGKDVLMVFVGILGTIMGFYYAENRVSKETATQIGQAAAKEERQDPKSAASVTALESNGYSALFSTDYDGAVKAFADAENARPGRFNEILTFLRKRVAEFEDVRKNDDEGHTKAKAAWKNIFCDITNGQNIYGMTPEMIRLTKEYCANGVPSIPPPTIPTPSRGVSGSTP